MYWFKKRPDSPTPTDERDKEPEEPKDAPGNRRVIQTARTLETINEAAKNGFRPLIKPVLPNREIHYMLAVFQNTETGEIELAGDMRDRPAENQVKAMEFTDFYPYHFPNPYAAYLVPPDLAVDEVVWLEDVIEDIVAVWGNQGYHPRLEAAPARWTGTDFKILFDPKRDAPRWIG